VELEEGDQALGMVSDEGVEAMGQMLAPYMGPVVVANMVRVTDTMDEFCKCKCGKHTSKKRKIKKCMARELRSYTMYKTKAQKVQPVDDEPSDGSVPEGNAGWKQEKWEGVQGKLQWGSEWDEYVTPRFSELIRGFRMTPERLKGILDTVQDILTPRETELFTHILYAREKALAWDFKDMGRIDDAIMPAQTIKTVPHKAWQTPNMHIPRALVPRAMDIIRERLEKGVIEEGHGAYRNPWFLVQKKDGGLRLINNARRYNAVTLRDALIPTGSEEIAEEFSVNKILTFMDLFSGYDQVALHPLSRDLTTFLTPLGLFRMCTLPMGATNSPAQFLRAVMRLLYDLIPHVCRPFMDDIGIKGPESTFDDEEALPGVRRYILLHLINIDKVLVNLELGGSTASATKTQWCKARGSFLGFICGTDGRQPDPKKVIKLLEWTDCYNITQVRGFVGLAGYYRVFIEHFAQKVEPLNRLLRKSTPWTWGEEQRHAMSLVVQELIKKPVLVNLDYTCGREIILMVDASLDGWGGVLMQIGEDGHRHPVRFFSGVWSPAERRYDATKRECRGLLSVLKAAKRYLYGAAFTVETDAVVLISWINGSLDEVPGAILLRWMSWIRNFTFDIRHVPGAKNTVADALSRKPPGPTDQKELEEGQDIDDFVDAQIYMTRLSAPEEPEDAPLDGVWSEEHQRIAKFLITGVRPAGMTDSKFKLFCRKVRRFVVRDKLLWKISRLGNAAPARVLDDPEDQAKVIRAAHHDFGHKGRDSCVYRLKARYWWKGMYVDVEKAVRACDQCQRWGNRQWEDGHGASKPSWPFFKVHIDVQYMPSDQGKTYMVEARCDLTGFVEAQGLARANAKAIYNFLVRTIFTRYGVPGLVIVDGGSENKGVVIDLCKRFGVQRTVISAYNARANGIVENGHLSLSSILAKSNGGNSKGWMNRLPFALLVDRTTIRRSHGRTPFYLVYGYEPVLPIEIDVPTWRTVDWNTVYTAEDLFEARLRMLERREADIEDARVKVTAYRQKLADQFNKRDLHRMRPENAKLSAGDLVLVYDSPKALDMSREVKLSFKWQGPYRVESVSQKNAYKLITLDGHSVEGTFTPQRLKKYFMDGTLGIWVPQGDDPLFPAERILRNVAAADHTAEDDSSGGEGDETEEEEDGNQEDERDADGILLIPGARTRAAVRTAAMEKEREERPRLVVELKRRRREEMM
jgi:hypothetical protein